MIDLEPLPVDETPPRAEYWHLGEDGEGCAGPFPSIDAAKADALTFLHDHRWHLPAVKIVKVIATSHTQVTYDTTWSSE